MNTTNYQQPQLQHQQQQQISPAIPQPPPTTTTVTPDCNTSYSSVDSFMSIMADQQQQQQQQHQHQQQQHQQQQRNIINQPHFQSNVATTTAADQNINGISMLQRLDYLTFHGFMAAVTDNNNNNNNNNMSTGLSGSNLSLIHI